jgi:ribulose-5-phosphate 4-epimerase/fuculose-1-phosphate aldolase
MNRATGRIERNIVTACKILSRQGLVEGFGHVSARLPNSDRFILTPRISLDLVKKSELLQLDLSGRVQKGSGAAPLEAPLHAAIYGNRPAVGAITRIHGRKANYFGATDRKLEPLHNHGSFFIGGVPVFPKSDLIASLDLGHEVATRMGHRPAILLRGNGQVTVGRTIAEAVMMAIYLEETADVYYGALQIGTPVLLSAEEAGARAVQVLPPVDLERAWNFFRAKVRQS